MSKPFCIISGKVCFRDRKEAVRQCASVNARTGSKRKQPNRVYQCSFCGSYHYGREGKSLKIDSDALEAAE